MTSLGDFGTPREAYDETFGYFGATIRVHPDLSDLALIDFAVMGDSIDEETSGTEAIGAVMSMLRAVVHPEDFDEFWSLSKANRQTVDDLTDVVEKLVVAVTERPTQRPSASSRGQRSTGERSEGDSSSRVVNRLEEQGRPDLALLVQRSAASA